MCQSQAARLHGGSLSDRDVLELSVHAVRQHLLPTRILRRYARPADRDKDTLRHLGPRLAALVFAAGRASSGSDLLPRARRASIQWQLQCDPCHSAQQERCFNRCGGPDLAFLSEGWPACIRRSAARNGAHNDIGDLPATVSAPAQGCFLDLVVTGYAGCAPKLKRCYL